MTFIEIRKVNLSDIHELQSVSRTTFFDTFAKDNTESDMQFYLDNDLSLDQLTVELNLPNTQFHFVVLDQKIIGYLKTSFGDIILENKSLNALEIERIYILHKHHGRQIGQHVLDFALEMAKSNAVECVWLGVWEHNPRAIRFYEKNDFVIFGTKDFMLGSDTQTDLLMKIELS